MTVLAGCECADFGVSGLDVFDCSREDVVRNVLTSDPRITARACACVREVKMDLCIIQAGTLTVLHDKKIHRPQILMRIDLFPHTCSNRRAVSGVSNVIVEGWRGEAEFELGSLG